jgi:hypothetical protein
MERFSSLGVIEEYPCKPLDQIDTYFAQLQTLFAQPNFTKADVVNLLKVFVPNFEHEEKGKNLDQKM